MGKPQRRAEQHRQLARRRGPGDAMPVGHALGNLSNLEELPKSACRPPANLPSTRIRARIIAPVTPSLPSAVLAPSIRVHRWIRGKALLFGPVIHSWVILIFGVQFSCAQS